MPAHDTKVRNRPRHGTPSHGVGHDTRREGGGYRIPHEGSVYDTPPCHIRYLAYDTPRACEVRLKTRHSRAFLNLPSRERERESARERARERDRAREREKEKRTERDKEKDRERERERERRRGDLLQAPPRDCELRSTPVRPLDVPAPTPLDSPPAPPPERSPSEDSDKGVPPCRQKWN